MYDSLSHIKMCVIVKQAVRFHMIGWTCVMQFVHEGIHVALVFLDSGVIFVEQDNYYFDRQCVATQVK